ncbi:zinc finger protein 2 homolog isoform X3 [Electrophorus electricus]|uniref:zinc finger protein 2 homolog isoform X3 n=1 Tax=Electrophorus electricus TaxID=8005 RepID=UPI0015D01D43|nr:zinc finger protein 2 homolog isoform X3 [Electrophorus electricus]
MTKMEYLNSFFVNRLMAAAGEIFDAVKDAVSGYQQEVERTKQENRRLMRMLAEMKAVSMETSPADVHASDADGVVSENQNFNQGPLVSDPSLIQLELATMKQEADTQLNEVPTRISPCAKSAHGEDLKCFSVKAAVQKKEDDGLHTNKMITVKLECCGSQLVCPDASAAVQNVGPSGEPVRNVEVTQGPCLCPHCEETFDDLTCLTLHLQNHTDGLFDCKVCGKPFTDCNCLTTHKKVLLKQGRLYRCKLCGKSFRYPKSLTVHLRTHTGEKPYCCKFCGKGFSQKGHCNEHERIHTGEKPYTCPLCGKGFVQSTPLKSHIRNHHRDQLQLLEGQKTEKAKIRELVKKGDLFS